MHQFKAAADAWKSGEDFGRVLAMRAVYDAVFQTQKALRRQYVSGRQTSLIRPAVSLLDCSFTKNDLNVADLAALCGISEVYFRRLFFNTFGVSPKEYMIRKRMEYAKTLLWAQGFSVSQVARMCGYAEPCHFSREFSKRVGVMPSRFSKK